MSDITVIERIVDVTPLPDPLPPNMEKESVDTDAISNTDQEGLTTSIIRSQPSTVTPTDPNIYLHSRLKNTAYEDFLRVIQEDHNYLVDRASILKFLYDIDYYDGDQEAFMERVNNLLTVLNLSLPTFILPYLNVENSSSIRDLTKENDFLRNIVKRATLIRQWAGTTKGYKALFKFINRLGAVHIGAKYKQGSSIDKSTERFFRLLDETQLELLTPNSVFFPDSVHIDGAINFNQASTIKQKWDTAHTWDETPILTWDQPISSLDYGRTLLLDISLDRILLHTNAVQTNESLMDDIFLQAVDFLLPQVRKANNNVIVGSQISLVTSTIGHFNDLSLDDDYTHPNIKARFQIIKSTFSSVEDIKTIKVGSGGYKYALDDNRFVPKDVILDPVTGLPPAPYTVPSGLDSPVLGSDIGQNERLYYNDYYVVHPVIHSRIIDTTDTTISLLLNGVNVATPYQKSTLLLLDNTLITEGSLSYTIDLSVIRAFTLTINAPASNKKAGIVNIAGTDIEFSDEDIVSQTTITNKIMATTFAGWTLTRDIFTIYFKASTYLSDKHPLTVTMVTAENLSSALIISSAQTGIGDTSIFQKVVITEKESLLSQGYDAIFNYKTITSTGVEIDITQEDILYGYSTDSTYSSAYSEYLPTSSIKGVILNQLINMDAYPTLYTGKMVDWNLDSFPALPDGTATYKQDAWATTDSWVGTGYTLSNSDSTLVAERITLIGEAYIQRSLAITGSKYIHIRAKSNIPSSLLVEEVTGLGTNLLSCLVEDSLTSEYKIFIFKTSGDITGIRVKNNSDVIGAILTTDWVYVGDSSYAVTTKIDDISNTGNAGILQNARIVDGVYNKAILFESSNSYLVSDNTINMDDLDSLSVTAYFTSIGANTGLICGKSDNTGLGLSIGWEVLYSNGTIIFTTGKTITKGSWSAPCPTTGLHHISVTFSHLVNVPSIYIDGILQVNTVITTPSGTKTLDASYDIYVGGYTSSLSCGSLLQEVRLYNRVLTSTEIMSLKEVISTRNDLRFTIDGDPEYIIFDAEKGSLVFKAQYNPVGIYQELSIQKYEVYSTKSDQMYQVNNDKGLVSISEMGLFNNTDEMVAYATFPPIIYDSSKHHLAFNILLKK